MSENWLVTGALGCIGAWVVKVLVDEGAQVTTLDLQADGPRLDLVAGRERLGGVRRLAGDIRDLDTVRRAVDESSATQVVHLAALQVPFCKADPTLGAEVNVVGTVNVFQALAELGAKAGLVYASSVAALDRLDLSAVSAAAEPAGRASTLYGVYKRANEGTAHVYWTDHGLASTGLRPHTVYGPGRDQGVTSQPTQAMQAAVRGEPFHIGYGGKMSLQYAEDVAHDFIAAARAPQSGAPVVNLGGTHVSMADVVAAITEAVPESAGSITFDDVELPFPSEPEIDPGVFTPRPRTSLADGVRASVQRFREVAAG
jgi:nucleoside-diphosphate-sugar epimerase